jgi:hypothetical protein
MSEKSFLSVCPVIFHFCSFTSTVTDFFVHASTVLYLRLTLSQKILKIFPSLVYKCRQVPCDSLCNLPWFAPIYKNGLAIISKNSILHSNRDLPSFTHSIKLNKSCVCLLQLYFSSSSAPSQFVNILPKYHNFYFVEINLNLDNALQAELQAYFSNATVSSYTNSLLLLSFNFTAVKNGHTLRFTSSPCLQLLTYKDILHIMCMCVQ